MDKVKVGRWAKSWACKLRKNPTLSDQWFSEMRRIASSYGEKQLDIEVSLCLAMLAFYRWQLGEYDEAAAERNFSAVFE